MDSGKGIKLRRTKQGVQRLQRLRFRAFDYVYSTLFDRYKSAMNSKGFSPSSVSRAMSSIRGFYKYLTFSGDIKKDPSSKVKNEKIEKKDFEILTSKEIELLLAQPDINDDSCFKQFGTPRLGVLVTGGNLDSMVAHYTAAKKKRSEDLYSPGGKAGFRPDRAVIAYCNAVRRVFGSVPLIIGGIEASLRRFAHFDYWQDKVRRSILFDSRADILIYGMGESQITEIAKLLDRGVPIKKIKDVRGTCYIADKTEEIKDSITIESFEKVSEDKKAYANANFAKRTR
jgi:hypothetical protein